VTSSPVPELDRRAVHGRPNSPGVELGRLSALKTRLPRSGSCYGCWSAQITPRMSCGRPCGRNPAQVGSDPTRARAEASGHAQHHGFGPDAWR
jgi:hypothetical protein